LDNNGIDISDSQINCPPNSIEIKFYCYVFFYVINKRSAIQKRNISYTNQGNILAVGVTEL